MTLLSFAISLPSLCFQFATMSISFCFDFAITLLSHCYHFVTTLLSLCFQSSMALLPTCYHFATTLLSLCWDFRSPPWGRQRVVASLLRRRLLALQGAALLASAGRRRHLSAQPHYHKSHIVRLPNALCCCGAQAGEQPQSTTREDGRAQ